MCSGRRSVRPSGWDGTGEAPKDPITGKAVAATSLLTIAKGSITSVGAIDPRSRRTACRAVGIDVNDSSWIDPGGTDITAGGIPQKSIVLAGKQIADQKGSTIEMRGGGDLYAYRWAAGIGGTADILGSSSSFAVLPGQGLNYAPYAAFNTGGNAANLGGNIGYMSSALKPGDRVYLGASDHLAAGYYTLLPSRYALLPGAVLVTPKSGVPVGTQTLPDGSTIVSGFRTSGFNASQTEAPLNERFEIATADIVRDRAEYHDFGANTFLRERAGSLGLTVPRLPIDAGHLILSATDKIEPARDRDRGGAGRCPRRARRYCEFRGHPHCERWHIANPRHARLERGRPQCVWGR